MSDSTVSWQTAFWAICPILLSCVAQPAGTTFSKPQRFRFYLRARPIVCLADGIALVFYFFALAWAGKSFKRGLEELIRFRDLGREAKDDKKKGFRAIEDVPILRFILLAVAFISAIKILASTGLPWTQFCAYCWIIPWLFYEALGMLSTILGFNSPKEEMDHVPSRSNKDQLNLTYLKRRLSAFDRIIYIISEIVQHIFLYYIFVSVVVPRPTSPESSILKPENVSGLFLLSLIVVSALLLWVWYLAIFIWVDLLNRNIKKPFTFSPSLSLVTVLVFMTLGIFSGIFGLFNTIFVLIFHISPYIGVYGGVFFICSVLTAVKIAKQYLLLIPEDEEDFQDIAREVFNFSAFLMFVVFGFWYYPKVYDASGTYKPGWLEKLP